MIAGNVLRLDKHCFWSITSDLFFIFMSDSNFERLLWSFSFAWLASFIYKIIKDVFLSVIKRTCIKWMNMVQCLKDMYLFIEHFYGLLYFVNFSNQFLEWWISTCFSFGAVVSYFKPAFRNLKDKKVISNRAKQLDIFPY